jgi:hypothetical protein
MTCNYVLTKKEQDEIEKLIQSEINFVNFEGLNSFNDYSINEEVVWIDGVSADHVDLICTSLFDLTQKYHD